MPIATLIKVLQDIMRKDVGVDGDAQRISQIVWLLFLKIFDDREEEWFSLIPNYKSPLHSRLRWANWAKNPEGISGEELIDFVNNDLFPALKKLATSAGVSPQGKVVGSVFEDAYNYMKSGTLVRQVISTIEADVDFNSSADRHLFNDIYDKILADLQSAGNAGEYYTPRAVTQFMVDILNPKLGESILDPAWVPLLVAGLWSVRELAMGSWPYSGFPWARIGMTQANGPMPEAASWVGVTGLTFLIVTACACLVQWWRYGGFRRLRGILPAAGIVTALVIVPQFPTGDVGRLDIGWVQGNGPSGYFDDRTPGDVLAAQTSDRPPAGGGHGSAGVARGCRRQRPPYRPGHRSTPQQSRRPGRRPATDQRHHRARR